MTDPVLRIIVVPATSQSRTYEMSYKRLRMLRGLGMVLGTVVVFMIATWGYMASRVSHMVELEAEVALMRAEQERIPGLRRRLTTVERQYADIRGLFAPDGSGAPSELWLPPPGSLSRSSGSDEGRDDRPDSWPLVERGFVTQGRYDEDGRVHPGLDIATPTGSYIRAAGAGRVMSDTSVELGEEVRKNEVIALSGSTGESTAPHLHFEIWFEGEAVDPFELVREP